MIFDRFFDHFSIIKNRHAGMRIQFWMSDMASGNPNWISGHVTKDTQRIDQNNVFFRSKYVKNRVIFVCFSRAF